MINYIKANLKTEWYSVTLIVLALLAVPHFYSLFPDQVPVHWDFNGQINAYASPRIASFFIPILMIIIYTLFMVLPYLDKNKEWYKSNFYYYHVFKDLTISLLFILYFIVSLNGIGYIIDIAFWAPILVGSFLISFSFILMKLKATWHVGITLISLSSVNDVDNKAGKFSNIILLILGLLLIISSFVPVLFKKVLLFSSLFLILFSLPIYSWIIKKA